MMELNFGKGFTVRALGPLMNRTNTPQYIGEDIDEEHKAIRETGLLFVWWAPDREDVVV